MGRKIFRVEVRAKRGEDEVEMMIDGVDVGKLGMVNYEDLNCNVLLLVFSIYGNYDDFVGEANLSVMDVFASAGLVNYFGKYVFGGGGVGCVDLKLVLLCKG